MHWEKTYRGVYWTNQNNETHMLYKVPILNIICGWYFNWCTNNLFYFKLKKGKNIDVKIRSF